jgi:hypothetical protein
MVTPEQRQELLTVLRQLNAAYETIAKIARPHAQEPTAGLNEAGGWQDDGTPGDLFWEGRKSAE